jgi:hypothetical protein
MPFDFVTHDRSHPVEYQARMVEDWTELAQEVYEEHSESELSLWMHKAAPRVVKMVGTLELPCEASFEGMQQMLVKRLNGGVSGMQITHSAIGGTFDTKQRTPELL